MAAAVGQMASQRCRAIIGSSIPFPRPTHAERFGAQLPPNYFASTRHVKSERFLPVLQVSDFGVKRDVATLMPRFSSDMLPAICIQIQDLRSLPGVIGLSKGAYTRFYGSFLHDKAPAFVRHRSSVIERRHNGRNCYTEPGNFAPF